MALNSMGLGFLFTAKDMASKVMRKLQGNLNSLDNVSDKAQKSALQHGKSVAAGAVMIGVGAKALRGSLNLASSFGDFEQGLARVGVISNASQEDLGKLEAAATRAGIATQFSPTEAILGLQQLASVGFKADEAISLLEPSLGLAAAGAISVEQATSTLSAATKIFNLDMKDATFTVDKLNKISNLTSLQQGDLQLALGNVARGASVTGQKLDTMLVAMGLVKNTGVDASSASTGVSTALLKMAQNAKQFKKLGVQITDSNGEFRNMLDIMVDVNAKTSSMGNAAKKAALLTKLFGVRGLGAAQAIGNELSKGVKNASGQMVFGAEAAKAMMDNMANAGGTTKKFVDATQKGFKGQVTLLKGSLQTLAVTLGKPIATAMLPVIKKINAGIIFLIEGFKGLPGPVQKVIGALFLLVPILLVVVGTFKVVMGVLALYKIAIAAAATVSTSAGATIGAAFLAAFWWLAIIGAVIGAAYLIWDNWEIIAGFFVAAFEWVTDTIADAFLWMAGVISSIGKALWGAMALAVEGWWLIIKGIFDLVAGAVTWVGGVITSVWSGIVSVITPVFDFIKGIIEGISDFIDFVIEKIGKAITLAKEAGSFIGDVVSAPWVLVSDTLNPASDNFGELPSVDTSLFGGGSDGGSGGSLISAATAEAARQNSAAGGGKPQPINISLSTNVDGEIVAATTKKFLADEKNRSFGAAQGEDV